MRPFFVADRPMSLRVLKGLPIAENDKIRIGIMAHANTTKNFQNNFREYPCDNLSFCDAVAGPCQYPQNKCECPFRKRILERTTKMCDSGIFTREGATLTYKQLFDTYVRMGVEYGIMIDVFRDAEGTLKSAEEALQVYEPYRDQFKLIAVAQGNDFDEYLYCYEKLKAMGFTYIAVGGLLQRQQNTVRFVQVGSEEFMVSVLRELRARYPDDWLFALGCFNPSRIPIFSELNVWADYKGWIFQYKKRDEVIHDDLELLATNHLQHIDAEGQSQTIHDIQELVDKRKQAIEKQQDTTIQLQSGKRILRSYIEELNKQLDGADASLTNKLGKLTSRGLLDSSMRSTIEYALAFVPHLSDQTKVQILSRIDDNRTLAKNIKRRDKRIENLNQAIASSIQDLINSSLEMNSELIALANELVTVINSSEQEHRLSQIRHNVASSILSAFS